MNFWGPLLGGMLERKYATEAENRRQGDLAAQREQAVFTHLLSADNPEVAKLAIAGLLDSAQPRRKAGGLRGWVGETMASPYLAKINQYLGGTDTVQESVEGPPTLGSVQSAAGVGLPNVQPSITEPPTSAGMPETSPVQPGAPPPTPVRYTQAPPTPTTLLRMVQKPRQAFLSPVAKAAELAGAKELGDIAGMRAGLKAAGFADEESGQIIKQHLARRYAAGLPYQHVNVEVPDGKGGFYTTAASYDRTSGQYLDDSLQPIYGARPVSTTASATMGVAVEPLARAMFGKRGVQLSQTEMAQVLEAQQLQKGQLLPKDAMAAAQRFLPNATIEQQMGLADALLSGTKAPALGGTSPPTPTSTPGAPPAATPPDTQATPGAPPTPATVTAPPKGKLGATLTPEQAGATKETGKPLPPAVASALAKAKSTNDLIDQAITALTPFKEDNSLEGSIKIAEAYRHGEYSPVYSSAAQLADLAGLQSSAQGQLTGGASRALKFYVDRRQHVPRLPSGRQATASHIPLIGAKGVERISELRGDEGGFDSPAMMYQKLQNAKENNLNFIRELESATREPMRAMPSHEPTAGAPGSAYKDAAGVWHIRQ